MAQNKIQIKRSTANAVVTGLSNGELAFTQASNTLWIGLPNGSGTLRIAGAQVPGVLTANQALVANATSGIDKVIAGNVVIGTLTANNSTGTAGQLLTSNGSTAYWSTPDAAVVGSNTQIQYNDSGSLAAAAGLTFDKTTNNVTIANTLSVGGALNVTGLINRNPVITLGGDLSGSVTLTDLQSGSLVATIQPDSVALGTDTTGNYVGSLSAANGIAGAVAASEGAAPSLYIVANNGIVANSSGVFAKQANGITVDAGGINVLAGTNGGLVSNSTGVFVTAGSGLVTNSTGVHVGTGNGVSVSADAVAVLGGSTLTVNATGVHVNNTLSITDLSLSGNLTVLGTLSTIDTTNLTVKDSIIELANGNSSADLLDIGLYGQYGATGTRYTGIFRDASDGIYKVFANSTVEPTTTVDTGATGYVQGTIQSFLNSGAFVANLTNVSITANSTVAVGIVANTLTLSTPLIGTSGGTGKATVANNSLLVGNSTNGYNELTLNTNAGYVLQSNGTALVYDTLDGGTF